MHQLGCKLGEPILLSLAVSVLDGDILSLNPAKLAQLLTKRTYEGRAAGSGAIEQENDSEDFPCLLRGGSNAQRKEHGKKDEAGDEIGYSVHLPRNLLPLWTTCLGFICADRCDAFGSNLKPKITPSDVWLNP